LGLKYAVEQRWASRLQLSWGVSGTYLLPSTQARRLPRDSDDALGELLDPATRVGGGARALTQLQLRYGFPRWAALSLGLIYQNRFAETLEGREFAESSYELASGRSVSRLLSTYASLDLSSIQSFIEGKFLMPALAEVGVGLPLLGRNALAGPVLQVQGTLFF
jgi:hypothetical protein